MATIGAARLLEIMDQEGRGPSEWRERDCVTLVRAVIRELSGREPVFDLPAWASGLSHRETVLRAFGEYGSIRTGWRLLLDQEPLLRRFSGTLQPGLIALTQEIEFAAGLSGALLGVIGTDCALWVRTYEGLKREPVSADIWEVRCHF